MDSRVLRTMRSRVPCRTSDLDWDSDWPIGSPCWLSTYTVHRDSQNVNREIFVAHGCKKKDRLASTERGHRGKCFAPGQAQDCYNSPRTPEAGIATIRGLPVG